MALVHRDILHWVFLVSKSPLFPSPKLNFKSAIYIFAAQHVLVFTGIRQVWKFTQGTVVVKIPITCKNTKILLSQGQWKNSGVGSQYCQQQYLSLVTLEAFNFPIPVFSLLGIPDSYSHIWWPWQIDWNWWGKRYRICGNWRGKVGTKLIGIDEYW